MLIAILITAVLAAGHVLGRWRPARRASDWAWCTIRRRDVTRSTWRWWATQPVFAVEIALLFAARPRATVRAWRHRNDPPPSRSAPVRIATIHPENTEMPPCST